MADKINVNIKGSYDSAIKVHAAMQYQKLHNNEGDKLAEEAFAECYSAVNSWRSMVSKKLIETTTEVLTEVSNLLQSAKEAYTEQDVLIQKEAIEKYILTDRKPRKKGPSIEKLFEKIDQYIVANGISLTDFEAALEAHYED